MRIFFHSLTLPKKAARRVQNLFGPDFDMGRGMTLSTAQRVTAAMLGYTSWHELEQATRARSHPPSPMDEDVSPAVQSQRIDFQNDAIKSQIFLIGREPRRVALRLRVSARNPQSTVLTEPVWAVNHVVRGIAPDTGGLEWRFFPSERSRDLWPTIEENHQCWMRGFLDREVFCKRLWDWRAAQPENLMVIEHLFSFVRACDSFEAVAGDLNGFESAVVETLPQTFPSTGAAPFCPRLDANDVLSNVTYDLAEAYYRQGNFLKARRWFEFTARTAKYLRPYCLDYLKDLKRLVPCGRVHKVPPQDRELMLDL